MPYHSPPSVCPQHLFNASSATILIVPSKGVLRQMRQSSRLYQLYRLHRSATRFVESTLFSAFILACICINALVIIVELEDKFNSPWWQSAFSILNDLFLTIYLFEAILKVPGGFGRLRCQFDLDVVRVAALELVEALNSCTGVTVATVCCRL